MPAKREVCGHAERRTPHEGASDGTRLPILINLLELNLAAVEGLLPERTFLVEIDLETAVERVGDRRDRIEQDLGALWSRVEDAYRELAARFPERYVVVDGRLPVEELAAEVRDRLR